MAVQKSRVTRSRRGQRRSHDAQAKPNLSEDTVSGESHLRHHLTPDGYYRGVRFIEEKPKATEQDPDLSE